MADSMEIAIRVMRHIITTLAPDDPDRARGLSDLGTLLSDRYSRIGSGADLEEAIRAGRAAVDITPRGHPDRAMFLNKVGTYLGDRYLRTGEMADLEEAIQAGREAIDASPLDHPYLFMFLNNLGNRLGERHLRTGAMADLEEAIRLERDAIRATPKDDPERAASLTNLGNRLGERYLRTGAMADLEEAIRLERDAIRATPQDNPEWATPLTALGVLLHTQFLRTGAMGDLEEAISVKRKVIDGSSLDHPIRAQWLNNLGVSFGERYSRTGAMPDLKDAICVIREAINITPLDHPDRALWLNNLGGCLRDKYFRTGLLEDLEEAIQLTRKAIDSTPQDHPGQATTLINLGVRLGCIYPRTGAIADLEESKKCFKTAMHHSAAAVSTRVTAGRYLLSSPAILQDRQTYDIAKTTIDLIPLLAPRSLQNSDKTYLLSAVVGLSSDAAAIALHNNRGPATAIELLETGRGVIAGTLFEQSGLAALERDHPDLARSFIDLRDQLDAPPLPDSLATAQRPAATARMGARQRRDAEPQLAALLETIRSKSCFERFLLAASEADMLEAARPGPIVVLNLSSFRCDALLIEQSGIRFLELPQVSRDTLKDYIQKPESLDTLGWLWDVIVSPVLDALGFTGPPPDSQWPHVWWVPTGALTRFPLHAAGHHLKRTGETAVDRVVSSYASSIKAIIHSRRRQQQAPAAGEAVVVAMQDTPKQTPLKHANNEIDAVVAVCESMGLSHDQPQPHKADVLSALKACQIFHFAGHGSTHHTEPLQSQLLLDDWDREPFTVASLLETSLTLQLPFLAYLSACGTGQIRHDESLDESIHLMSAFQLAGFRHVVGTLWEVDDELCVRMARLTYELLRDSGISDKSISSGLHHATRQLRDDWVHREAIGKEAIRDSVSARNIEKCESIEPSKPLWVPYVHYGV